MTPVSIWIHLDSEVESDELTYLYFREPFDAPIYAPETPAQLRESTV